MKITVFGATGPAGLLLVEKALLSGHQVTVYARSPDKITIIHNSLLVIKGELKAVDQVQEAISGADAVISLLGPKKKSTNLDIFSGMKAIISGMHKHGVRRLIAAVSSSFRDPKDKFQFGFDFSVVMLQVLAKSILKDIVCTGTEVAESSLDWTIVRLPMLSNKPATGKLNIGYTGDGIVNFFSLRRADLADFIITQLQDATYVHQAPVVSN